MIDHLPANFAHRVRGAIVAAAVGDALGWPQEQRSSIIGGQKSRNVPPRSRFRRWQRNSGTQFARYTETIEAGEYSDDTQLLLAVARCCLAADEWLSRFAHVELPAWTLYQRGGGRAVLAAARAWAENRPPWFSSGKASAVNRGGRDPAVAYFDAGSNGVVMRIAPHAVITAANADVSQMLRRVISDGLMTHGHPRALVGAAVHAFAMRHTLLYSGTLGYGDIVEKLIDDRSWQQLDRIEDNIIPADWCKAYADTTGCLFSTSWAAAVDETLQLLDVARRSLARGALANDEQTLDALGCFDKSRNGAGTVTAVAAAYLAARTAAQPMTGLLRAAFLNKADTDTLASATASLLGAIHETDWLGPLAAQVQDSHLLVAMSEQLSHDASSSQPLDNRPLLSSAGPDAPSRGVITNKTLHRFRDDVFTATNGGIGVFIDDRRCVVQARSALPMKGAGSVTELRILTEDGQSLTLHRHTRSSPGTPAERAGPQHQEASEAVCSTSTARAVQITVRVANLARAARFYRDVIGLDVQRVSEESVCAASWLTLLQPTHFNGQETPHPRNMLLTITVPSVEDVTKRAKAAKIEIIGVNRRPGHEQLRLRDPDGHDLKITQDRMETTAQVF
jgi:ADP-ribosylglycohydrolase/catechol 2,3-dioxygenase-like lactoylglutathione lyase family enzyme